MKDTKPKFDDKALTIPEWYADMKYNNDKDFREMYIDNALNPYSKAFTFYDMRYQLKKQQLLEAKEMEKKRQKQIKERDDKKKMMSWRHNTQFIL